jgi:hypothetical protein
MNAFEHTARLAQLVELKHEVLTQLCALAQRQIDVVQADEIDRLMSILAEKQPLLELLQRVERSLDPFRQEDPDARRWQAPIDRRRCQQRADRCAVLLTELMAVEKAAEGLLVKAHEQTSRELAAAASALAARQAYVAPVASGTRSPGLDLVSET